MVAVVITERGAYLVPPCPPWCTLRADHDLADDPFSEISENDAGLLRHHGRGWDTAAPAVAVEITWAERIGAGGSEPPALYVYADDCATAMTPAQARALAAVLVQAAEYFEAEVS